jgi:hypothetical protein
MFKGNREVNMEKSRFDRALELFLDLGPHYFKSEEHVIEALESVDATALSAQQVDEIMRIVWAGHEEEQRFAYERSIDYKIDQKRGG